MTDIPMGGVSNAEERRRDESAKTAAEKRAEADARERAEDERLRREREQFQARLDEGNRQSAARQSQAARLVEQAIDQAEEIAHVSRDADIARAVSLAQHNHQAAERALAAHRQLLPAPGEEDAYIDEEAKLQGRLRLAARKLAEAASAHDAALAYRQVRRRAIWVRLVAEERQHLADVSAEEDEKVKAARVAADVAARQAKQRIWEAGQMLRELEAAPIR